MTVRDAWLPSRPDSRALARPPSSDASREPMENMALGGPPGRGAVADLDTVTLSRPRIQRPKNSGAGADRTTRAALGSAASGVKRAAGLSPASGA